MEHYFVGEELRFSATNFTELRNLIQKAQEEARQLNETISRLENFNFSFSLEVNETVKQEKCF